MTDEEMQSLFTSNLEYVPANFTAFLEKNLSDDFQGSQPSNFKVLNIVKNQLIG